MFPITELFDKYGFQDGANKAVAYEAIALLVDAGIIAWKDVVDSCSHNIYIDRSRISKKTVDRIYEFFGG